VLVESSQLDRQNTATIQSEIVARWDNGPAETGPVRLVLPRFVPLVVDSRRTLLSALGGGQLNDLVYRVCRSPLFFGLLAAIVPTGYVLSAYILTTSRHEETGTSSTLVVFFSLLIAVAVILHLLQMLLFNVDVLRRIVLLRFDTYWALANVYSVAFTGAYVFTNWADSVVWVVAQVQMSSFFFSDATPLSARARKLLSATLIVYSAFQCFSVLAIWQHVYDVQDYYISVVEQPVNLKHWMFAAQANTAIIATRFAVRALTDSRSLIFSPGLLRTRLPAAEVLELRALMLAEKTVRHGTNNSSMVHTDARGRRKV
jgi:hypothetical protein